MADNYKFSQDYELIQPQKQRSYPISTTEWNLIKKNVGEVKDSSNFWHTIGSILIGAAISTLITALISDFKTEKHTWICWTAFSLSALGGILSFYFGKEQRKIQNKSKEDVIAFMNTIEERFRIQNEDIPSTAITSNIEILSATYVWDDGQVDVTNKIKELVSKGISTIIVDPSTFGIIDPAHKKLKTLKIHSKINGNEKEFNPKDGERFKLE